jgi:CBS domain-containing protein
MQVGDVLRKKTARVVTVRMNETVAIAAQLMRANNISALVVKDVVRTECNTAVGCLQNATWSAQLQITARPVSI